MNSTARIRPIVLIADDDDVTRLMLTEAAAAADLEVIAVADGDSAQRAGTQFDIAAALLDVEMPGVDGYTVCAALRRLPGRESLPIVMITGHDDARSVERAFEAGATDFIGKPVNWTLLPHRLRYIIRNASVMRSLERREAENRALIESIPDRVRLLEASGRVLRDFNGPLVGGPPAGTGRRIADLVPAPEAARLHAALQETARDGMQRSVEYAARAEDGSQRHYEMRLARCAQSEVMLLERDVTLRYWQQERIRQLAYQDTLTGLPNRQAFVERIESLLPAIDAGKEQLAILYVDLDDFRRINETFGHDVGDDLLRAFASLLRDTSHGEDVHGDVVEVARFGADEFVIALRHPRVQEPAVALAGRLADRLTEPLICGKHEFFLAASVGIALRPEHGHDTTTLIKNADAAMHFAKDQGGKGPALYAPTLGQRAQEQLALDAHLRRAVRDESFELYYQPKFRLADGRMEGAEALLRWSHPELGSVPPDRFIPLAEQSGLIIDLGAWVVRAACRQLRNWLDRGHVTRLAINMSGTEFQYGDPVRIIADACAASSIEPTCLEIEITESVLVSDSALVQRRLRELRRLGCRIALDDFGTGYSSLAYLRRFPPDTIKIDRVFVNQVHVNAGDAAIFDSVLLLARHFGLSLVAEGVENAAQLEWLRSRGCDLGQGYLFGRPMPAHRMEQLLAKSGPGADGAVRTGTSAA